jgi:hypothetical protein
MESGHLDNKPLGKVLDGIGYVFFVAGLLCALAVAYFERGELATKLDQGVVQLWPIAMAVVGFSLFLVAKASRIRRGKLVSFGAKGMLAKYSIVYFVGFILMAVGYGLTFSWMWK